MGVMDFLNKSSDYISEKAERSQRNIASKVRSELRRKSDSEVRNLANYATNDVAKELAREEARRRGISY